MALRISSKLPWKPFASIDCFSSNYFGLGASTRINFSQNGSPVICQCLAIRRIHKKHTCGFSTSNAVWAMKGTNQQSEHGRLIYVGSAGRRIKSTQGALYTIGGGLLIASPLLFDKLAEHPFLQFACGGWLAIFGFGNPLLFYKFAKRYVLELYHDKENDKYTAITISPYVFGSTKIVFSPEECRMPAAPTPFTTFLVKNIPLLVSSDDMSYTSYSRMLRYASDFDYENPERQSQYGDALQESIQRITKVDDTSTEAVTEKNEVQENRTNTKSKRDR